LFHILAGLRRSTAWTIAMHFEGAWVTPDTRTYSLFERRVGIHGFGRIARELVRLLQPFSAPVQVFAPDIDAASASALGVEAAMSLEALFSDNDVVVELAPLIPATAGIVGESLLRRLRPGAVFVNVGRGAVVDEAALIRVAAEGQIQVGLDVFTTEPLPADSKLRGLPNVSLTPHIAGPTNDRRQDAGAHALDNLRAFAAGRPLQAVVTPEVFDLST
jgi:phosphoglycerate dehydrogenase-like enzyme